ncbi:hypothetical protein RJ640_011834 [Escallonia rubra]|uniref:Ionotropic glutamate receptor C-terminal domain-containing protein n=1 Tax=Escallonia rubra TaxID=112253 RepID=A0AA88TZF1_9ASTE|nr:hypothetical protein RJ640_011834 [Escallonia rubra]
MAKFALISFFFVILFELHLNVILFKTNKIVVQNSKVDSNLPCPIHGGGQQDTVGSNGHIHKKWNVCAPKKDGFNEFVHVDTRTCTLTGGFSVDMFCAALQILPYRIEPNFMVLNESNCSAIQNYSIMLHQLGLAYTANLSSIFTVDQLQPIEPSVIKSIGYQEGSFVGDLLRSKYPDMSLKAYTTIDQYHEALMNKSVDVIYDELPYVNLFLQKHGSNYTKVGPIFERTGLGFAFRLGSPDVLNFSRAVVNVSESDIMKYLMVKYNVRDYPSDGQASPVPRGTPPLRAHTFIGLFILAGIGTIGAVLASEYTLWQRRSLTVEMTSGNEDFPDDDNQEHPPPVLLPSDVETHLEESNEVEETAEILPSQEVPRSLP